MPNIFDDTTNIDDITIDALVGDGKKFKTPDDLARGKAEADRVIKAREQELAELREELNRRATVEEILSRNNNQAPQSERQPEEHQPAATGRTLTDEDLAERVKSLLDKRTEQEKITSNLETVADRLVDVYGDEDKANKALKAKAAELGVSIQFLQDVGARSPKALFTTLGLDAAPSPTASTRSEVNTEAFGTSRPGDVQPGTYQYWEAQRKERGDRWYFTPEVQNAIMKDAFEAAKRGEEFGR